MTKVHFTTAGWDYKDWIGPFYPKNMDRTHHLKYFSKFFNFVEINSTFYNLPPENSVKNWFNMVPHGFQFFVKVWSEITHKLGDHAILERIEDFFYQISFLKDKLYGFLLQFPPWFKYSEIHEIKLQNLLKIVPKDPKIKYFIELRDNSWFNSDRLSNFINGENKILVSTYMPKISEYILDNQNYYYFRLIGDRKLTVFNRVQRTQEEAIGRLTSTIKNLQDNTNIYEIFIIVNNNFDGLEHETINVIKRKLNLIINKLSKQKKLYDFF